MRDEEQIQREINDLIKERAKVFKLKQLSRCEVILFPIVLRKHEKQFLRNFDKMNIKQLCKLTGKCKSQIYSYYKRFDFCEPSQMKSNQK